VFSSANQALYFPRIAPARFELASEGYEPSEGPLLYSASQSIVVEYHAFFVCQAPENKNFFGVLNPCDTAFYLGSHAVYNQMFNVDSVTSA
jgi:hypothetical protein